MGILDEDAIKKELEEINQAREASGGGIRRAKLQDGQNIIRFLPPAADGGVWFYKLWQHWGILEGKRPITCAKTFGQECYACGVVKILRERDQQDLANRWNSRVVYMTNVFVLSNQTEAAKGVQMLQLSRKAFTPILQMVDGQYKNLLNIAEGRCVIVNRSGKGFDTEYVSYPDANVYELKNWEEIKKAMYDLPKLARPSSPEQMKAAIDKALMVSRSTAPTAPSTPAPAPATLPTGTAPPAAPVTPAAPATPVVPTTAPAAPPVTAPSAPTAPPATPEGSVVTPGMKESLDNFLTDFEKGKPQ